MRKRQFRRYGFVATLGFAIALAAGAAVLLGPSGSPSAQKAVVVQEGVPAALANRMARLRQAMPGNVGMAPGEEGPATAGEEKFLQEAYPATDIPLAQIVAERTAFARVESRGRGGSRNQTGVWHSVGPSRATYQLTPLRRPYVPNEYIAGGRTTSMAIAPNCRPARCRVWLGVAGGGIWRTNNAFTGNPRWRYLSAPFAINAVGAITVDPNDSTGNTLWVGTGEANASGDSAAGVGLYKSTDGGNSWTGPIGQAWFNARSIGSIAIDPTNPQRMYVSSTRGVRGVASVTGGVVSLVPGAPAWGLYRSTNGGASFQYVHNGAVTVEGCNDLTMVAQGLTPCSPRGVRNVRIDPTNPNIIYASSYARGVWRSNSGGTTWTQINPPLVIDAASTSRPEIAVTRLPNGNTRMYLGEGSQGVPFARLLRSDDVATGTPTFTNLTSSNVADEGYGSFAYCDPQCWYDNVVVTPPGRPDTVLLGGSHRYAEAPGQPFNPSGLSNGRGLVMSTNAGVSFTDLTEDSTDADVNPNGLHPDHHAVVFNPRDVDEILEAGDGGVMRSNGRYDNISHRCDGRPNLTDVQRARCRQLLSRVPRRWNDINRGLRTLQFQSLSVNPRNWRNLQGGTQDNGTFETTGSRRLWPQTIWGDGGQSGFDAEIDSFRFHTYFNATPDVNFNYGAVEDWIWIADRIFGIEPQAFYIPIISDPVVSKTMYAGLSHVWRTKTAGQGDMTYEEFRETCSTHRFDLPYDPPQCGDWEPLATTGYVPGDPPNPATRLTAAGTLYGTDRAGGTVAATERTPGDTSTLWAATSTGRVFVSQNADAEPAGDAVFTRIDPLAFEDPGRFVSSIYIDPANPLHAWISYSGFNANTPGQPGHVFEVTYDPDAGEATWENLDSFSGPLGDLPVTDLVRDDPTGDLYAATDFGVTRLPADTTEWVNSGEGLPNVEVAGLTIVPGERVLYAATHGLSAWRLFLDPTIPPEADDDTGDDNDEGGADEG